MSHLLTLFYCLLLTSVTEVCFALEGDNTDAPQTLSSSPLNSSAILETFGGLLLVLALIAFLAWLIRRTGQFNSAANGDLKIIAGLSLGSREKAILLQVGEQQILVGVTPQHIQTLHVLDSKVGTAKKINVTGSFTDKLQQIIKQQGSQT